METGYGLERVSKCDLCGCVVLPADDLGRRLPLVRCAACGLLQQSPRPVDAERRRILAAQDYSPPNDPGVLSARVDDRLPFVDFVERFVGPGRLLDIGVGDGTFVAAAERRGWNALGVELASSGVTRYERLGGRVRIGDFMDLDFPPGLDAVTFFYSLEHFVSPRAALAKTHALLADLGIVLVEMVTVEALMRMLPDTLSFGVPARHFFPTLVQLRELLWTSGFTIECEITDPIVRLVGRKR